MIDQWQLLLAVMARCKQVSRRSGDDDERPPPRIPEQLKGKGQAKKIAKKERKRGEMTDEEARAVVAAAEWAEQGGS